jgi:serine/threonine protein kinase
MAPETYDQTEYIAAVDVYSIALILYELLCGKPVFLRTTTRNVLFKQVVSGVRPRVPSSMELTVRDIIEKCWLINPEDCYPIS